MNLKETNMKTFDGKLKIDRTPDHEWGMLLVDENIRKKCFDLLGLGMIGFSFPDYEAHISAFDKKEVKKLPEDFWFDGKLCEFTISHLRVVNPNDWGEVNACIILCVKCKPLEHLRKSLGFPSLMYGDHEFHITIGVREGEIDGCVDNVVRLFNDYLKDDFDVILQNI